MPLFSVVIPTWNRAELLRQALDSVFAQCFADFEIIVVDDGSTDDTASVVASYGDRVRYLRQENRGPGSARNLGISQARGYYVTFLDSDDLWFPWTLAVFRETIQTHGEPSIVAGGHVDFKEGEAAPEQTRGHVRTRAYADYLASARDSLWLHLNATAVRRDCLSGDLRFSGADINGEDHDFLLQLGTIPGFVHVLQPPLFAYRRQHTSRIGDLTKTLAGARYLVHRERAGAYPGGTTRQRERREVLGRHLRPVVVACAKIGHGVDAWQLYCLTLAWNLKLGRLRFLFSAPVLILNATLRRRTRRLRFVP